MSDAYEDGLRLLARRSLTRSEVKDRLLAKEHPPAAVKDALSRLAEAGFINDRRLAEQWIGTAAAGRGRGRERAVGELEARGVDPEIAAAAWTSAVADGVVEPGELLGKAVRRRLGAPPGRASQGKLARVYNALLLEGFEREQVVSALSPYGFEGMD